MCRICYHGEQRYITDENNQKVLKHEKLLRQICKCKGELNYVHESCLIKWLSLKGSLKCELCLEEYNITYEFGSFREIVKQGFQYALKDKRRLVRGLLYALYLWIFFRRFVHMIKSILRFMKSCTLSMYKSMNIKKLPRNPNKI